MQRPPNISVVVSCFGHSAFLEEALASFDLQGMEPLEEEELDVDDILEFDDLSGYIQEVEDDE